MSEALIGVRVVHSACRSGFETCEEEVLQCPLDVKSRRFTILDNSLWKVATFYFLCIIVRGGSNFERRGWGGGKGGGDGKQRRKISKFAKLLDHQ